MSNFLEKNRHVLSISLILLLTGIAVSIWFRAWSINAKINADNENQTLVNVINELEAETLALEGDIEALRSELSGQTNANLNTDEYIARLQQELAQIQLLSGQTPVTGSGITITLNDNTAGAEAAKQADPGSYYPENYIIHDS
ncbi:MAG: hypothetical protein IJB55_02285, partial [Firmicutes bacterium]|nr:hypothetical protein [Bacillota bacterium]